MQNDMQGANENVGVRILLVDDHPIIRQGLRQLIALEPDLKVCGEAESASEAFRALKSLVPDLAVIDISLKDSNGIDLVRDAHTHYPNLAILVLSMHNEGVYAERVLRAGASGYITKDEAIERFVLAIRKVLAGEVYLTDKLASSLLSRMVTSPTRKTTGVDDLSNRELQVFDLIGQGLNTRGIADRLHVSPKTVESHRENIKKKLRLADAAKLLRQAVIWHESCGSA